MWGAYQAARASYVASGQAGLPSRSGAEEEDSFDWLNAVGRAYTTYWDGRASMVRARAERAASRQPAAAASSGIPSWALLGSLGLLAVVAVKS